MKKFGFGKKAEGDDDDRNRAGLFGRKKPAPQEENPYAQQPAEDPYARMTPYQQARANLAAGPQISRPSAAGLPSGPRPGAGGLPSGPAQRNGYGTPPPSYQGSPQVGGGYAPDKFGAAGGYGGSRYDTGASGYGGAGTTPAFQTSARFASRGPGGYGGLGPADEDANRDELLAGARQRHAIPPSYVSTDNNDFAAPSAINGTNGGGGGGYGEQRELTAEEQEEEEYQSIVNQGKQMKRDDLSSLQRSNQVALQTLDIARGTTARLGEQEERLRNAERNLQIADFHHKIANDKTRELKTLNRSMFAVHVANPFTKGKREAQLEQAVLGRHREDRDVSEATRRDAFRANQQNEQDFKEAEALGLRRAPAPDSEAARARRKELMFDENDSEEEQLENGIQEGQEELSRNIGQLKKFAEIQGKMVDRQIILTERMTEQASYLLLIRTDALQVLTSKQSKGLDEGLAVTRAQLSRIR